jgi:Ca-activated chloride channel family protein
MNFAQLADFHFLRPAWLLLLLALPLLWRALKSAGADAQAWRGAVDAHLLEHLIVRNADAATTRSPLWLAVAALALASLALAGPAWERLPQPLYKNQAARVIALELSPTMAAQDVKPSRYERARFKIADILKRSGDAQVALIAYAGDAFVVAPLTDDANTVANLVDSLEPSVMPASGNDTGKAIDLGVKLIRQAGMGQGEIVVLADSVGTDAEAAAARAYAAGVRVSALGVGSAQGAPIALGDGGFLKDKSGAIVLPKLDGAGLAALARAGGGHYAEYRSDAGDLDALLGRLAQGGAMVQDASGAAVASERFLDRGPWLLLLLLPLVALGFRRGWLMLLPLVLLAQADRAEASVWTDLWQRADQQAQAQLDAGQAKEAQALARSPGLRGTAAYRAGDYAAAATDFSTAAQARKDGADPETADAEYNRGNALAKQGKLPEAIAAYDEALKRAPDMDDAKANRKAVEDFLKKQQQQKQDQQKNSQDHQGNKQQQPGNDQPQDSKDSKDGNGEQQGDDGSEKKESKEQGKDDKGSSEQNGKPQDSQQQDKSAQGKDKPGDEKNAAQQPQQGSEAGKESQEKYQQSIDKALDKKGEEGKNPQPVRLGAREGEQRSEQNQAVEQWLQRVPDDPGGLLRRKFQLEYQRRQNGTAQEGFQ